MREWLIELGKTVFALGFATTKSGQPPQDFQYYGIGLYLFVFGCACLGLLIIIGLICLIKYIRKKGELL